MLGHLKPTILSNSVPSSSGEEIGELFVLNKCGLYLAFGSMFGFVPNAEMESRKDDPTRRKLASMGRAASMKISC